MESNREEIVFQFVQYLVERRAKLYNNTPFQNGTQTTRGINLLPNAKDIIRNQVKSTKWRDWNEILQKEIESSVKANKSKLKVLDGKSTIWTNVGRIAKDFTDTAIPSAKKIVQEFHLQNEKRDIRSVDSEGLWYFQDGIFFQNITDLGGIYGDSEFALKAASHEMKGSQIYLDLQMNDDSGLLHFPLVFLIDYLGHRILITTIPPIESSTLIQGTLDGKNIVNDPQVNEDFAKCAQALRIKEHQAGDVECHKSKVDGRIYVVNLARVLPPTSPTNNLPGEQLTRLFRYEFLAQYKNSQLLDNNRIVQIDTAAIYLNEATSYLVSEWIPTVAGVLEETYSTIEMLRDEDFHQVVQFIHRNGVNLRYMGILRSIISTPNIQRILLIETLARAIKGLFRSKIRETSSSTPKEKCFPTIAKFFNTVFTEDPSAENFWNFTLKEALQKGFIKPFTLQETEQVILIFMFYFQPLSLLRLSIPMPTLFSRVSSLLRLTWSRDTEKKIGSAHAKIEAEDLLDVSMYVKFPNIVSFFIASQFQSQVPLKYSLQLRQKLLEKACDQYSRCLDRSPRDILTLVTLADAMHQRGLFKKRFGKKVESKVFLEKAYELFDDAMQIDQKEKKNVANHYGVALYKEGTLFVPLAPILKKALEKFTVSGNDEYIKKVQSELPMAVEHLDENLMTERKKVFKISVIGNYGVGKTSLITRYTEDSFSEAPQITTGNDFKNVIIEYEEKYCKLKIGDTAGQEQFRLLTSGFYRDLDGIVLAFDISDNSSFNQAKTDWYKEVTTFGGSVLVALVGMKSDLGRREVQVSDAEAFAKSIDVNYYETSAKDGTNVDEMFYGVVKTLFEKKGQRYISSAKPRTPSVPGKPEQGSKDSVIKPEPSVGTPKGSRNNSDAVLLPSQLEEGKKKEGCCTLV